jgi:hypothetical protein
VATFALLLIVLPLYLNQRGIALASPMTVRVAHAAGPIFVFGLQCVEGRLPASAWSRAAIAVYSTSAAFTVTARQWRVAADDRLARLAAPRPVAGATDAPCPPRAA